MTASLDDVVSALQAQQVSLDHIAAMLKVVLRIKGFNNTQIEAMA
jgi:hypothetical protein